MKFYDIDALESKCGSDNKYKITALVAARARWLSEKKTVIDAEPANEKYLSAALLEFENGELSKEWLEEVGKKASQTVLTQTESEPQAEPSQTEPSRTEPSRTEPSQAETTAEAVSV